jgi:outer membrane protein TolC
MSAASMWRNAAASTVALMLAACASFQPAPLEPAQNARDLQQRSLQDPGLQQFVAANLDAAAATTPGAPWNLDSLTLAAFYFQPELDVARAQWAVAEAARTSAGERPGVGVGATPGINTTTSTPTSRFVSASADLTLELGGKREHRIAKARQLAEAARLNVQSVAWQVRSRVRGSLIELYSAREAQRLLSEQQAIQQRSLGILDGQQRAGAISAFELGQARVAAANSRVALRDAERREAEARVQLAGAVGIPVAALADAQISFAEFEHPPADLALDAVQQQAMMNRADLLGALAQYAASQSALQLAIAGQYPDLHLGPGYEYDQGDNKWSLGLSISLPPDGNRGAIATASAQREQAAAEFNALQAGVLEQIELAAAGYRAALQKQADVDAMLGELTTQESQAQGLLDAGEISGSDLAALRLQLSESALLGLDARVQAQQALARLEDAAQIPLGLPGTVWEQSPRPPRSTGENTQP